MVTSGIFHKERERERERDRDRETERERHRETERDRQRESIPFVRSAIYDKKIKQAREDFFHLVLTVQFPGGLFSFFGTV